uniref:ATP synthase F0 subunit 8 n=1 Tax=Gomphus vulgatissimus TaxID=126241 RepID=UPI001EDDDA22|nr:ATP synthase F0 subunit 8 [Gomphus vulgatissimus]UIB40230.1 ATP synthase F0 subunit 8 [Gomphus vulgatissimus]
MPQMAPMSWLLLFLFFTIMLILFNTINYYLFIPKIEPSKTLESSKILNMTWKW